MIEYAIYPFECMRITQTHEEGNHLPHWQPFKDYSDKPWDEATQDGGRGYFVPKNDYRVVEKTGNQTNGYNIRLETVNKVKIPYQNEPVILEVTLTHLNYDDWSKVSAGQIIHKGEKILREGTSGQASGNHLHCTVNFGKYWGFKKNSNGKWVFAYDKALTPTEAWYIDDSVQVANAKGYDFKVKPNEPVPSPYPFNATIKKGSQLYDKNGKKYNKTNADRNVTVQGEYNGRYEIYGETFNPHIVYCDKSSII